MGNAHRFLREIGKVPQKRYRRLAGLCPGNGKGEKREVRAHGKARKLALIQVNPTRRKTA